MQDLGSIFLTGRKVWPRCVFGLYEHDGYVTVSCFPTTHRSFCTAVTKRQFLNGSGNKDVSVIFTL